MTGGCSGCSCSNANAGDAQSTKFKHLSPLKESLVHTVRCRNPIHVPYPSTGESASPAATPPVVTSALSPEEARDLLLKEANYDCHAPTITPKRSSYISWDDYFMAIAHLSARRSKDPQSPTGACLVDNNNRVVGIGYNGFPRGCSDDLLPWQRNNENTIFSEHDSGARPLLHTPNPYECHAEINAILNKCSADVSGTRMYVAHFPCNECAKMIAQSRIRKVIYSWDDQHESDVYRASRIILQMAGVETIHYIPTVDSVVLDLRTDDDDDDDDDVAVTTNNITTICQDNDTENANASLSTSTTTAIERNTNENLRDMLRREANWIPPSVPAKRKNVISWDDYFMAIAFLTAKRSKDPNTQVGACIVSRENVILALGYNGFPRGCLDDCLPWARQAAVVANQPLSSSSLHTKYPYVCHAEVNAILNKGSADVRDATLFVALFPCNECAKMIIQAGIVEVVYLQDHYHDTDMCRASRILFGMAGVKLRKLVPSVHTIRIELQR